MSADYESVLLVKPQVFVYRIPPRPGARGYRADEWKLDQPDWTGRLKVVARDKALNIRLEDKTSGELFAMAPVDAHPGVAVEAVLDSSRYFVLRLMNEGSQTAFVGIGFQDRGDAFDFNVALQDHFKWLRQEEKAAEVAAELDQGPKLNLGFKEGQTIKIQLNTRRAGDDGDNGGASKSRARPGARPEGGSMSVLLPPPPSGSRVNRGSAASSASVPAPSGAGAGGVDLLGQNLSSVGSLSALKQQNQPAASSDWTAFE